MVTKVCTRRRLKAEAGFAKDHMYIPRWTENDSQYYLRWRTLKLLRKHCLLSEIVWEDWMVDKKSNLPGGLTTIVSYPNGSFQDNWDSSPLSR
jgi:hypothetical protein